MDHPHRVDGAQEMSDKDVLARIKAEYDRFVELLFTGIMGELKCVTVTAEEMPAVFESDKGVDGSSLFGHARIEESDQVLIPDPETFGIYPYTEGQVERR